jgi:conjugal transfer pilus assembly protein TraF
VFAPILRSVTDSHRMAVMAVSMDGGPSRDFPNYVVDPASGTDGVPGNETPALVLFDTQTKRTIRSATASSAPTKSWTASSC